MASVAQMKTVFRTIVKSNYHFVDRLLFINNDNGRVMFYLSKYEKDRLTDKRR